MNASNPGGTLFQLPREIRDEIYSHYFNKTYLVFWSHCDHEHFRDGILADLAILRSSKAIKSETEHSIFSRGTSKATTFKYEIDFCLTAKCSAPPTKEATDRMMNVEFVLDVDSNRMEHRVEERLGFRRPFYQYYVLYPRFIMDPICEATLDRFTGTAIVRDSCRLHLNVAADGAYDSLDDFMKTRFFQTLKKFNGFRTLTVVLHIKVHSHSGRGALETLSPELEPHLGAPTAKCVTLQRRGYDYKWLEMNCELGFQPLKFHVESSQAEAARLGE